MHIIRYMQEEYVTALQVDGLAISDFYSILYRFANGGVGMNAVENFLVGFFLLSRRYRLNDDLGYIVSDHMSA